MKIILSCILFLCICVTGFLSTSNSTPMVKPLIKPQVQAAMAQNSLSILSSLSSVKRGETGAIIIKGKPKTLYSITTSYKIASKTVSVVQWRTTDVTGVATFNWIVSYSTVPGTYNATISGGSETLYTKHIVLP
jgi:hypothetical protein